jgi:RNA 2',3'-cyclic 3'-phosphodiesterase
MVRLFVAIDLPHDIRERMRGPQEHLKKSSARLNPVDPALIHITLKFIGEVNADAVAAVISALSSVTFSPYDLQITGIGANNPRQPRVIWCEIADGGGSARLHALVEEALLPLGIPRDDRPFRPHATLARVKQPDPSLPGWIRTIPPGDFGMCTVKEFRLKKSTLTPRGPVYETLLEVPAS